MNRIISILLLLFLSLNGATSFAQVNYSANDLVPTYDGFFRPGTNLGEYPSFSVELLAELSAGNPALDLDGVGVKALRPGLFESYLELFGYESLTDAFMLFDSLDISDNTMIVGFPSPQHQDPTFHCPNVQSTLFANLYTDIWDNGENGTPVNDDNYYALYLYRTASIYKDHIKFWEIWNEPGFDYTEAKGFLPPGTPGNWWDNNPDPCDYKLRAPIFHYVRMLRISYEVIKSVDPTAYIAVSGVGYPSFLDAILRNTDNPFDGSVNDDYPLQGGAYFDVMGYHSYPHFDGSLRYWDNDIMAFAYRRHSDAAVRGVIARQDTMRTVLAGYGYDGLTYPQKPWIITECNLPRKPYEDFIGSAESQRNFVIKAQMACLQNDILQFHIFKLAEDQEYDDAYYEFDLMGLYKKMDIDNGYFQRPNDEGIAYKTATDLTYRHSYDAQRTAELQLPDGVLGLALVDEDGNYTYVLWAETTLDNSEAANATYSFPSSLNINTLISRAWDFSHTQNTQAIAPENIALTGAPIFLSEQLFTASISSGCTDISFQLTSNATNATSWQWQFPGATPASSTLENPSIVYSEAGLHEINLQVFNANGGLLAEQSQNINIQEIPQASFNAFSSGPVLNIDNTSTVNSDSFLWNFGDGTTSTEPDPEHLYLNSGTYTVTLVATNLCGATSSNQTFTVIAPSTTQLNYTADDLVAPYNSTFRPGVNIAYYPPWTDEQIADIAAGNSNLNVPGAGVKSLRTLLPQYFLEFWGYDVRVDAFEHYHNIDLQENVVTVGFPSVEVQDPQFHCPEYQSTLFDNLYLDIWDDGSDGTPINEENHYAAYLYQTVNTYKDQVRFWEILNGPDFDASGEKGWLPPGEPGNWWESNPDPCDYALRAPIFYYIRMLRISYEIIKTLDEDSYVTLSGIAFPSFLDALLRNTDNPIDGSIVNGYDKKGGAYFDAVGFSSFPHFDGSTVYYDLNIGGFAYERHSDAAVLSIPNSKQKFEAVLENYGYDGSTFPEKQWIISACNLPRKSFDGFMGSAESQRNFLIKAYIASVENDIRQFHVRQIGELETFDNAIDAFQLMGLYEKLEGVDPYNETITDEGIAYKTVSDVLFGANYDPVRTAAMNLPDSVKGAAFVDGNGQYSYVLWAKTQTDLSEEAAAIYTLPVAFGVSELYKKAWDYSQTGVSPLISTTNIALTGSPIFLTEAAEPLLPPLAQFNSASQEECVGSTIQFTDASLRAESWAWSFPGGEPATSSAQNPSVQYNSPGNYPVTLVASNAAGSHSAIYTDYIFVDSLPEAAFEYSIDGPWVNYNNLSTNADNYVWDMGDGSFDYSFFPNHYYFDNGVFNVVMIAMNDCGFDTTSQVITLNQAPQAAFSFEVEGDCAPYTVTFIDLSPSTPTAWNWAFPGADIPTSDASNPSTTYALPGIYPITLIASNEFGSDTLTQNLTIGAELVSEINMMLCPDESIIVNGTVYDQNQPTGTEVLAGQGSNGCDSVVVIDLTFYTNLESETFASICEGEIYEWGGGSYSDPGIYILELTSVAGCDSTAVLMLEVEFVIFEFTELSLCPDDFFDGMMHEEDFIVMDTLQGFSGCDSLIIVVNITIKETFLTELSATIMSGETYMVGTSIYDTTGFYTDTLIAQNDCDSIVQLTLTVDVLDGLPRNLEQEVALQYFPNPFTESVDLHFELPEAMPVAIELFNVQGQQMQVVQTENILSAGDHHYVLGGDDLAQGVYLCRLWFGGESMVIRLVRL